MKRRKENFTDPLGGNRGSIELAALFTYFCSFLLCLFIHQRLHLWNQEASQRVDSLFCFKKIMDGHALIHKRVDLSNKIIKSAHLAFLASANPLALKFKKVTQAGQSIMIASYFAQLYFKTKCRFSQKILLSRMTPLVLPLKRSLMGEVVLKKGKKTLLFPLTFAPVKRALLKGEVSMTKDYIFTDAKEWTLI